MNKTHIYTSTKFSFILPIKLANKIFIESFIIAFRNIFKKMRACNRI